MLEVSAETNDDIAAKFVLLKVARDIASEVGDLELAEKAISELDKHFEIDDLGMRNTAYGELVNSVDSPELNNELVGSLTLLIEDLKAADRFDEALKACDQIESVARKLHDSEVIESISETRKQIESIAKRLIAVNQSIENLKSDPEDPEANLIVGKYKCFTKGEWDDGLELLVLGSDDELRAMAQLDSYAEGTDKSLEIGNAWWSVSDRFEGIEAKQIKARAAQWYSGAIGDLAGIHRLRIEQRINDAIPDSQRDLHLERRSEVAVDELSRRKKEESTTSIDNLEWSIVIPPIAKGNRTVNYQIPKNATRVYVAFFIDENPIINPGNDGLLTVNHKIAAARVFNYRKDGGLHGVSLTCEGIESNTRIPESLEGAIDITKLVTKGKVNRFDYKRSQKTPSAVKIAFVIDP